MLKAKNESLLNDLNAATIAKQRVQRTRKWTFFFSLVLVAVLLLSENVYLRISTTVITIGLSLLLFQFKLASDQMNLKDKYSTARRAGDEVAQSIQVSQDAQTISSKSSISSMVVSSSKYSAPKATTLSPFKTSSREREELLSSSREEPQSSFDYAAAERLLAAQQREREEKEEDVFFEAQQGPSSAVRGGHTPSHQNNLQARLSTSNLFGGSSLGATTPSVTITTASSAPRSLYGSSLYHPATTQQQQQAAMERERDRASVPAHHTYHLSPLNMGPRETQPRANVQDALQALELRQLPEMWIDTLREVLGKDLARIMKLFDESVREMVDLLRLANIPAHDQEKALLLLEFRSLTGREVLANRSEVTLDDVVNYARSLGLSAAGLQKFQQTVSFVRLCQWMVQLRQKEQEMAMSSSSSRFGWPRESYASQFFPAMFSSSSTTAHLSAAERARKSPLVDRLRVLAQDSGDFGLRVHWSPSDLHELVLQGRVEHEILDQEVALALFLHRCDSTAALRGLSPSLSTEAARFSQTHIAFSQHDLATRVHPALLAAREQAQHYYASPLDEIHTLLVQRTASLPLSQSASSSSSASSLAPQSLLSQQPHYDVVRVNAFTGGVEEALSVDVSRQDVFEALLVLMLVVVLTHSPDRSLSPSEGESDAQWSADYRVVLPLVEEVVGRDELQRVIAQQRLAQQQRVDDAQRRAKALQSEQVVSSGFGFGTPSRSPGALAQRSARSPSQLMSSSHAHFSTASSAVSPSLSSMHGQHHLLHGNNNLRSSRMLPAQSSHAHHTPMSVSPSPAPRSQRDAYSTFDLDRGSALDASVSYTHNFSRYYNPAVDFASPR